MRWSIFSYVYLPFFLSLLQNSLLSFPGIFKIPQVTLQTATGERVTAFMSHPFDSSSLFLLCLNLVRLPSLWHILPICSTLFTGLRASSLPTVHSFDQVLFLEPILTGNLTSLEKMWLTSHCLQTKSELIVPFWLIPSYISEVESLWFYHTLLLLSTLISY